MRTTLTLDADVAEGIERARASQGSTLKQTVNTLLRMGLRAHEHPAQPTVRYTTQGVSAGECLVGSLDDIADVLALAEGEQFG